MTEPPLERAWQAAQEERPWEPPGGWDALLRRKRREPIAVAVLLLLVWLPVQVIGRGVMDGEWVGAVLWGALALLYGFALLRPLWSTSARLAWEGPVRDRVRTEHALRHHVGVGADFRAETTDRAEQVRTASMLAWFGWPTDPLPRA